LLGDTHALSKPPAANGDVPIRTLLVARPDPMPYRAPTPVFDTSGQPSYAAAAKQKAQAEAGGQFVDDASIPEAPRASRWSSRNSNYRSFDRHRVN